MKKQIQRRKKLNNKGFAVLESVVIFFVFLILFWYSIGFFGIVHTAILQSTASRNYAFEIFRHRANLWYFRGNKTGDGLRYHQYTSRLHGTNSESVVNNKSKIQYATERRVAMGAGEREPEGRQPSSHIQAGAQIQPGVRNTTVSLDPVWVKAQYGICLTVQCGD